MKLSREEHKCEYDMINGKFVCEYCGKRMYVKKGEALKQLEKLINELKDGEYSCYSGWTNLGQEMHELLKRYKIERDSKESGKGLWALDELENHWENKQKLSDDEIGYCIKYIYDDLQAINRPTQPTLEELKQSIIDECYNTTIDDSKVVKVEICEDGDNIFIICTNTFGNDYEIARYDSELGLQLEWYFPIDLARDITTYFIRLRDEK
jgi:uncharacterized Zn finger protein (UPF0148 family)